MLVNSEHKQKYVCKMCKKKERGIKWTWNEQQNIDGTNEQKIIHTFCANASQSAKVSDAIIAVGLDRKPIKKFDRQF